MKTDEAKAKLAEVKTAFTNANPFIRTQVGHVVVPMLALIEGLIDRTDPPSTWAASCGESACNLCAKRRELGGAHG